MTVPDLLTLMDREAAMLAADNNHSAAGLMREAGSVIRAQMGESSAGNVSLPPRVRGL